MSDLNPCFREWIPVNESVPLSDGIYETLVKPVLETESIKVVQKYERQAHSSISGFRHMPVTHWRGR